MVPSQQPSNHSTLVFIDLPERLLAEYKANRSGSELGRILATAARLRDTIDKIVVLGIGGSYMGRAGVVRSLLSSVS